MNIELKTTEKRLEEINETLIKLYGCLEEIKNKERPDLEEKTAERIAELEIKMAKLWGLLITSSELTKEEKLTKQGRKFSKLF